MKSLQVNDTPIKIVSEKGEDYVCLTDIAKSKEGEPGDHIKNWLRSGTNIRFLGVWETVHNPNFEVNEYTQILIELTDNAFLMSAKKWIKRTTAIGLRAKAGRYGGTYAHSDIAIQFATWLNPQFYVYLIKEFQQLKQREAETSKENLDWNIKRTLSKVNYKIHAEAIREHLIPARIIGSKFAGYTFANEADLLNMAVFGLTAKAWRSSNPDKKGNIRDFASAEQLLVLANLESLNAAFILDGLAIDERLEKLNEIAIYQLQILLREPTLDAIKKQQLK